MTNTAIGAGGTQVHVISVYGWLLGTPDQWKKQNTLWKDMFGHVAGLGDVPWVMAGDWSATPDQRWAPALAPRASGWLPNMGGRRPTCFPVKGAPTEKYFFLVSHCLRVCGGRLRVFAGGGCAHPQGRQAHLQIGRIQGTGKDFQDA